MTSKKLLFTEDEINSLFGNETAEDESSQENFSRFLKYYFRTYIFNSIQAKTQIQLLVGYKGIGKSAVFRKLQEELDLRKEIFISITPSDINQPEEGNNMAEMEKLWRYGLKRCITEKVYGKYKDLFNIFKKIFEKKIVDMGEEEINFSLKFIAEKKTTILIDDIDKEWTGSIGIIHRTSSMINAIRKLAQENENLYFKISLRTDAYYQYRKSDESTDKVEQYVLWLKWTDAELLAMLAKRIITYFGGSISNQELSKLVENKSELLEIFNYVFEKSYDGEGKWEDIYIYDLLTRIIRKRPRDLVKICRLAGRKAFEHNKNLIGTNELSQIFDEYSQSRLQDTFLEYRSELRDIDALLQNMKPTSQEKKKKKKNLFVYTNDELDKKIQNIMLRHRFYLYKGSGKEQVAEASIHELKFFMYKINFLLAIKNNNGEIIEKYFEEQRYLMDEDADYGFKWEIHRAFHWALNPGNNAHDSLGT